MRKNELNANNLKNELFETMKLIKAKKLKPNEANAIASTSREIMRVVKTEILIAQLGNSKPNKSLIGVSK